MVLHFLGHPVYKSNFHLESSIIEVSFGVFRMMFSSVRQGPFQHSHETSL